MEKEPMAKDLYDRLKQITVQRYISTNYIINPSDSFERWQQSQAESFKNQYSCYSIMDDDFFAQCEQLGEGTYGHVYKAYDKSDNKKPVAIKRINKKGLVTEELEFQQQEVTMLRVIREDNTICVPKLLDVFEDAMFLSIVMEYKDSPNLLFWLKEQHMNMTEDQVR